ncbi:MAG: flavin reductase family protein [Prevotellaceae bacterium]|jgi:flavin reductase (DIM6/NTAB) family NADH-FMN oxidoreductase RutF|nr:flavin reductase family protein [Prevotellaceae bacterium]
MNKQALTSISYGMYIIGTRDGERLAGCTINTAMQVSSAPVVIAVCVNRSNYTNECIKRTGSFALSVLSEDNTAKSIGIFGFQSGRTVDKFTDCQLTADGLPVLKNGICAWLSCRVVSSIEVESHTVFFGELTDAETVETDFPPMTYDYYHKVIKGKAPAAAPTFAG